MKHKMTFQQVYTYLQQKAIDNNHVSLIHNGKLLNLQDHEIGNYILFQLNKTTYSLCYYVDTVICYANNIINDVATKLVFKTTPLLIEEALKTEFEEITVFDC